MIDDNKDALAQADGSLERLDLGCIGHGRADPRFNILEGRSQEVWLDLGKLLEAQELLLDDLDELRLELLLANIVEAAADKEGSDLLHANEATFGVLQDRLHVLLFAMIVCCDHFADDFVDLGNKFDAKLLQVNRHRHFLIV